MKNWRYIRRFQASRRNFTWKPARTFLPKSTIANRKSRMDLAVCAVTRINGFIVPLYTAATEEAARDAMVFMDPSAHYNLALAQRRHGRWTSIESKEDSDRLDATDIAAIQEEERRWRERNAA